MVVRVLSEAEIPETPVGGTAGDDVRARRAALFEKFDVGERPGGSIDLTKMTEASAPKRELIDSVTVLLEGPDGHPMEVEFGPPPGISLTMRIGILMGEENVNRTTLAMLRTLMCVRSINGATVTPVTNKVEAQALANIVGDQNLDRLFGLYVDTWPVVGSGDLQILRKNKRVA